MSIAAETRPPLPPFTRESAVQKVRLAEDAWNSRDARRVALAYTLDSKWRNRAEFPVGRAQIQDFLAPVAQRPYSGAGTTGVASTGSWRRRRMSLWKRCTTSST